MPFEYILANLLARSHDAVGVLFLDDMGEAVDVACSEFSPFEMRVVGAYLGIYLRQAAGLLTRTGLGRPCLLHIERGGLHIHVRPLPEGYYLALVQRRPALVGQARKSLLAAAEELRRELFERS